MPRNSSSTRTRKRPVDSSSVVSMVGVVPEAPELVVVLDGDPAGGQQDVDLAGRHASAATDRMYSTDFVGLDGREVLEPDRAVVAGRPDNRQLRGPVEVAAAGLVAAGGVGDLHVLHEPGRVRQLGRRVLALGDRVVEVVEDAERVVADRPGDDDRVLRAVGERAGVVDPRVDRLEDELDAGATVALEGLGEHVGDHLQVPLPVHPREADTGGEHDPGAAELTGVLDGEVEALVERREIGAREGVAHPRPGDHRGQLHAGVGERLGQGVEVLVGREPHLDGVEAGGRGGADPVAGVRRRLP